MGPRDGWRGPRAPTPKPYQSKGFGYDLYRNPYKSLGFWYNLCRNPYGLVPLRLFHGAVMLRGMRHGLCSVVCARTFAPLLRGLCAACFCAGYAPGLLVCYALGLPSRLSAALQHFRPFAMRLRNARSDRMAGRRSFSLLPGMRRVCAGRVWAWAAGMPGSWPGRPEVVAVLIVVVL